MSDVRLTRDLLADGYTFNDLARQQRTGDLVHIRRGAYGSMDLPAARWERQEARHRLLVESTVRLLGQAAVVSHSSAALLHGLPVFAGGLGRVQLTRPGAPGGKNRGHISMHAAPLDDTEMVSVSGILVTSLARTVVDVARSSPFDRAVMVGDAALRSGLTAAELELCLDRSYRRPGMANARRVAAFIDGRSESPGESLSRVALHVAGIPKPELQFEVFDEDGNLIGRSDFGWPEHRTLGEFDGRIKYGRLLKPGQASEDVLFQEKRREDHLRDHGLQMARWVSSDLKTPLEIGRRVERAFSRNSSAH